VPGVEEARALYKALGLDPTKTRPSNEALLRRALKGEALYRVNTLVDALNLCSLRAQLPFGLYDLGHVEPPVVLRRGRSGEAYEGIRKGTVNVEGRPVLVDSLGPFGNPSSDSARTMIRPETQRALVTLYAPAGYGLARLAGVLDATEAALTRFAGGRSVERGVLPDAP
jgi:DNA/RNA-binding domain of Phe-tRNA-synthetase-like protein